MKVLGINHIGMAAKDLDKARWFFGEVLNLPNLGDELVKEQKTLTTMFNSTNATRESTARLELLSNQEGQEGPIKAYMDKKGGGIHHIALSVDSVDDAIDHMRTSGVKMIDDKPRAGAHQTRIAFVHPHATGGFLVELVEETQK